MTPISIKPISSVQPQESTTLVQEQAANQPAPVKRETVQAEGQNSTRELGSLTDVSIHFRVDDKTKDVTVFLVDRKSKKVLRSIPASDLSKLQISDLLKMTA